jgi:hypothetical protein
MVVLWCYDLTSSVCPFLCGLSALGNAARVGVTRNRSQHLKWTCWAAYRKERERERFELWETISNLGHCENVDEHRHIWPCVQSWYKPMTINNKKADPKQSTMAECPSSGIHRRFPGKPSTSIESWESRKLKSAQLVLSDKTKPYFSKLKSAMVKIRWRVAFSESRSGMLKSVCAHAHGLKASSSSSQKVCGRTRTI